MKYRLAILKKLEELSNLTKDFSFGEVLYSFMRKSTLKGDSKNRNISWLLEIKDEDFYTAIERAINIEKNYKDEN